MPKRRPANVHQERNRHGKPIWYHRIGKGKRTRLWETYGTKAFLDEVKAAAAGSPLPRATPYRPGVNTVAWAIGIYTRSQAWNALSAATRKQRDCILKRVIKTPAGNQQLSSVTRKHILDAVGKQADRPAAARHFLQTMRGLFTWAINEGLVTLDPTVGVVAAAARTEGHLPWTDEDIAAYEACWPLGTRERVAFDILLWTGLRRGDAVLLGRPHVRQGVIRIKTEKTGEWVAIVITPELAASMEAGPCGDLAFIVGEKGLPRAKAAFGEWFRQACAAAGIKKSAHGLRKTAATRAANNGATEKQLEAMFGWRGGRMASHYTRSADRERLAIEGAALLGRRKS